MPKKELKSVSKKCAVLLAFMWEPCENKVYVVKWINSLKPGSHMLAKKTAYFFDTDFRIFYKTTQLETKRSHSIDFLKGQLSQTLGWI